MTSKKLFLFSLSGSIFLLLITEPFFSFLHRSLFVEFESWLTAPLFYMLISYSVSSLILFFFSNNIFKLWLRRVVRWFLPVSLFAIFILGGDGNSYVAPSKTDYAVLSGVLLSVITIVFALVQKFRYKR
jgi:hypothetical protein